MQIVFSHIWCKEQRMTENSITTMRKSEKKPEPGMSNVLLISKPTVSKDITQWGKFMYFDQNTCLIGSFNLEGSAYMTAYTPSISTQVEDTPLIKMSAET